MVNLYILGAATSFEGSVKSLIGTESAISSQTVQLIESNSAQAGSRSNLRDRNAEE